MSQLIDDFSYQEFGNDKWNNRSTISFQNLIHYLQTFTGKSQQLKYFNAKGHKCDIIIQLSLISHLPVVVQKIHIDAKKLTYQSNFLLKSGSQIVICPTKCLRLMIMRQFQPLKKKIKVYSYTISCSQHTGQIMGKNILTLSPNTNLYELVIGQIIALKTQLIRFLTITLFLINTLPPLFTEFLHERAKILSEVNIEDRIQRRIYKYFYLSIIQMWKNYSQSPSVAIEQPEDKHLLQKLENQIPIGFNQQSSQIYIHRQKSKYIASKIQINNTQYSHIKIHLKIPATQQKRSESNTIFNELKVIQEGNNPLIDAGYRGATTKIMITNLKFVYLNSLLNPTENHNNRELVTKQYSKLVGIKMPLDHINIDIAKKKAQHQIKILKLFSDAQSPFLLRYYVCSSPTFKYNNMVMMNVITNSDNMFNFLNKRSEMLSFSSKIYLMINVLQGLRLIKQYNVVHMDLSPSNVIVNPNYMTQLIDFGQSYHEKICGKDYSPGYTLPFTFPEKFFQKKFTNKSDMFSFGILTFHTMFKFYPYNPSQKLLQNLKSLSYLRKFYFAPQALNYYGYYKLIIFLFTFIQRCMDPDPLVRPHPSWAIVLFKQLYYWLQQISVVNQPK